MSEKWKIILINRKKNSTDNFKPLNLITLIMLEKYCEIVRQRFGLVATQCAVDFENKAQRAMESNQIIDKLHDST